MTELKLNHTLNKCKQIIKKVATKVRVIRKKIVVAVTNLMCNTKKNKSGNLLGELGPSLYL